MRKQTGKKTERRRTKTVGKIDETGKRPIKTVGKIDETDRQKDRKKTDKNIRED